MVYENKQDWPEKYDINQLVKREDDIQKIIDGNKTSVRRNDRYADPGDELVLNGQTFTVENIYPQELKTITDEEAKQEGHSNLQEYKDAINAIHEGQVWDPERVVWAHKLKKQ